MEMVDIIIVDSSGEEILKTSIHSNLYIKQVKYDIYRTKFVGTFDFDWNLII